MHASFRNSLIFRKSIHSNCAKSPHFVIPPSLVQIILSRSCHKSSILLIPQISSLSYILWSRLIDVNLSRRLKGNVSLASNAQITADIINDATYGLLILHKRRVYLIQRPHTNSHMPSVVAMGNIFSVKWA